MQPYPSMAKSDTGDATISTPITEEEKGYALYVWKQEHDAMWESKNLTKRNLKQTHSIDIDQCL